MNVIIVVFVLLALGWLSTPLSWLTDKVLYGISWLVLKSRSANTAICSCR